MSRKSNNKKEAIQEVKSELFWYNLILFFWVLAFILKLAYTIRKHFNSTEKLIWELAILIVASLSFLCYFWMRRMKLAKKLKKLMI